jgi:hypothetical protein
VSDAHGRVHAPPHRILNGPDERSPRTFHREQGSWGAVISHAFGLLSFPHRLTLSPPRAFAHPPLTPSPRAHAGKGSRSLATHCAASAVTDLKVHCTHPEITPWLTSIPWPTLHPINGRWREVPDPDCTRSGASNRPPVTVSSDQRTSRHSAGRRDRCKPAGS